MTRLLAVLLFLLSAGMVLLVYADGQKAEPNPQAPATPQANTGQTSASSPQATPGTTSSSAAPTTPAQPSADDAALQGRIQQALQNEPGLSAAHISVIVTDGAIEISGTVASSQDKQTAERIAESFDGNRKFEDKLTVTGQTPASPPATNTGNKTGASYPR